MEGWYPKRLVNFSKLSPSSFKDNSGTVFVELSAVNFSYLLLAAYRETEMLVRTSAKSMRKFKDDLQSIILHVITMCWFYGLLCECRRNVLK